MALYDFQCSHCGHIEEAQYKIAECPESIPCSCGGTKKKIIALGHGGIQRDEPAWLDNSVREVLQDSDAIRARKEKPIETRSDYNRWMKAHPNIQPI